MNTLSIMYPHVMNIVCFSHSLDLVGTKFVTPKLDKFMKHWFGIFQHSSRAKLLWRELTGQSLKSFSATRWWSKWECQQQIMTQWGDVPKFLAATDVAPKSCQKLKNPLQTAGTELLIEWRSLQMGRVYINQHPEDARLTLDDLRDMVGREGKFFTNRVMHFTSSLRGTSQFWFKQRGRLISMLLMASVPSWLTSSVPTTRTAVPSAVRQSQTTLP